jgi:hypothetical protein
VTGVKSKETPSISIDAPSTPAASITFSKGCKYQQYKMKISSGMYSFLKIGRKKLRGGDWVSHKTTGMTQKN